MNSWHLKQAARTIQAGGVVAYPTEAVYGLGCDPLDATAVQRLLALKQRPMEKGLILIAADIAQLAPFMATLKDKDRETLDNTWPGPVTWVVPARPDTPLWLRGQHNGIAVRVTDHPLAAALCRATGHALVSTSANPAERPPARTALQVRRYFGQELDTILSGPLGKQSRPTPIRDLISGKTLRSA